MSATCQAAVRIDGEWTACGCSLAPFYEAISWGGYYGAPDVTVCERHAREAVSDGCTVHDDAGDEVQLHPETGELAKVVTIAVCT